MKKVNKKILFILAIMLITTFSVIPLQAYNGGHIHEECNCFEVEFENIPEDKAEKILNAILGIPDEAGGERGNFFCLFGHDKRTGTVKLTEHNYYADNPKCKVTYSYVEYCVRDGCDYYVVTGRSISREACH